MSLAGTRPALTERSHPYQCWETASSKPLTLPTVGGGDEPMGCLCDAVAVTSPCRWVIEDSPALSR